MSKILVAFFSHVGETYYAGGKNNIYKGSIYRKLMEKDALLKDL